MLPDRENAVQHTVPDMGQSIVFVAALVQVMGRLHGAQGEVWKCQSASGLYVQAGWCAQCQEPSPSCRAPQEQRAALSTLMDMRNSHSASICMGLHSQFRTQSCTHRPATHSWNDVMYMYAKQCGI